MYNIGVIRKEKEMEVYKTYYKIYALYMRTQINKIAFLKFSKKERIYILNKIIEACQLTIKFIEKEN